MFINVAGHEGTEMPSSFHLCFSVGYAQFSIRGAIGAYSIHLGINCLEISTAGITLSMTSIPSVASTSSIVEPLSSPIFETHATMLASKCMFLLY